VVLFQNCVRHLRTPTKMATTDELNLTLDPMGNSHKNLLVWNYLLNKNFFLISSPLFPNLHNRSKWVTEFTSKLQGR
jgi:hypothetical protein